MQFRISATAMLVAVSIAASSAVAPAARADRQPQARDVRWRITSVKLDGRSQFRLDDGDHRYVLDGQVRYRTPKPLKGKPFALRPGKAVAGTVDGGIVWSTTNPGRITGADATWNCAYDRADISAGLAGIFVVRGQRVDVQWSLAPAYLRCEQNAPLWTFDALPIQAMSSHFKRSLLDARHRRVKVPVSIAHRWTDGSGTQSEVSWDGSVTLERVL